MSRPDTTLDFTHMDIPCGMGYAGRVDNVIVTLLALIFIAVAVGFWFLFIALDRVIEAIRGK